MLVNVRVIVERMDQAGVRHEELFSVPADLLDRFGAGGLDTGPGSEVSTIALQLMEAFVKGYKEICHASIADANVRGHDQERGGSGAGGGTARSVLLHEDLRENARLARKLNRLDRGLGEDESGE